MSKWFMKATAVLAALLTSTGMYAQLQPGEIREMEATLFERYSGLPIPNARWLCSTQVVGSSGGHPHMEPGRPAGSLDPKEGRTDAAGGFRFKVILPELAGTHMVICTAPQFPTAVAVGTLEARVDDLIAMPSAFQAGVYTMATDLRHGDKIHFMARPVYQRPLQIATELRFTFPGMQARILSGSTSGGGINDRLPNPPWTFNADPHRQGREFDAEFQNATFAEIDATSARYNCSSSTLFFTDIHFYCSSILVMRPRPRMAARAEEREGESVDITDNTLSSGMRLTLLSVEREHVDEQAASHGDLAAQASPVPRTVGGKDGRTRVEREPGKAGKVRIRVPRRGEKQDEVVLEEYVVELADGAEPQAEYSWELSGNGFNYSLEVENGAGAVQAMSSMWFDQDLEPSNTRLTETSESMRESKFRLAWNHKNASVGLKPGEKTGRLKFWSELGPGYAELFTRGVRQSPKLPHLGSARDSELYDGDGPLSPRKVNKVVNVIGPAVGRTLESLQDNIALASEAPELAGIKNELVELTKLSAAEIREKLLGMRSGSTFQKRLIEAWLTSLERIR